MLKRINSLRGLNVAITGKCSLPKFELAGLIEAKGGAITSDKAEVKLTTNVLVRGTSKNWKYGTYGKKEARAAHLIRQGQDISLILSEDLDKLLRGRAVQEFSHVAGYEVTALRAEAEVRAAFDKGVPLDAIASRNVRLEQAALRRFHFGDRPKSRCCTCGSTLPVNLLVIAHIKRRSQCTPHEKRDFRSIAMPLCLLGCDAFFERGLITVSPQGRVVVSNVAGAKDLNHRLAQLHGRTCSGHSTSSEPYFDWHRTNVFRGPALAIN